MKNTHKTSIKGTRMKTLILKKMLQRLPMAFVQVKAGYTSKHKE